MTAWTDPRLACLRSAAGMAALALLAAEQTTIEGYRTADILTMSLLSIDHYLRVGVGNHGAPIGHTAHDEMLEIVVPFLRTWYRIAGQNLAQTLGWPRPEVGLP